MGELNVKSKVNILFPIEVMFRELDYRLVLAVLCAKPSNQVLIGQHNVIYHSAQHMRGGIYVGRNIFDGDGFRSDENLNKYHELKKRNFVIVHLDEEGGIFPGDQKALERSLLRKLNPCYLQED